jgi:cytochrome c553
MHFTPLLPPRYALLRIAKITGLALAVLVVTSSRAQDTERAPRHLDACLGCHTEAGANNQVPRLEGQPRQYLASQLMAFREGRRRSELMQAIAAQLADDEVAALARWWSTQSREPQSAGAGSGAVSHRHASQMRFPASFPADFQIYERVDDAAQRTVRLSYANTVAWQAAREGRALPEGSVIIVATHAAAPAEAAPSRESTGAGALVPGAVRAYAGMEARAGWGLTLPALLRNEDWNYALFDSDQRVRVSANQAECLACHRPRAADSFVFGLATLRTAARAKP